MCKHCYSFETDKAILKLEIGNLKHMMHVTHEEHQLFKADVSVIIDNAVKKIFDEKQKQCQEHIKELHLLIEELRKEAYEKRP
jgi:hemerythrin superfamily protein